MTTKTPIPRQSEKRKAAIADGTYVKPPRKPIARKPFGKVLAGSPAASKLLRRAFGAKPKQSLSKAKAKAWKSFSLFIRLRDADEFGMVKCCTCPARKHYKEMDAGHYITRAKASTFLDEGNCHGQCSGCNRWQGGKFFEHMQFIVRTKGQAELDRIHAKAGQMTKPTANDYLFWAKCYDEKVAKIAEMEPGKFTKAA